MNRRIKITLLCLVVAANIAVFAGFRWRRESMPNSMKRWKPFADQTVQEREEVIASAFALSDFDIQPLATESDSVTIPFPEKWYEQAVILTSITSGLRSKIKVPESTENATLKPYRAELTSIAVMSYETAPVDKTPMDETPMDEALQEVVADTILVKEKMVSQDAYLAAGHIPIPMMQFIAAGRCYLDKKDKTPLQTHAAIVINGNVSNSYTAVVPHWLFPERELAIGETWVQVGCHPVGVPRSAPAPEITRTLKRLVMFEGRRAAEIFSTAICYDYAPTSEGTHTKRAEKSVVYVDLETGEPLWFEAKSEGGISSLVRGCNQTFKKHLIPIPRT